MADCEILYLSIMQISWDILMDLMGSELLLNPISCSHKRK